MAVKSTFGLNALSGGSMGAALSKPVPKQTPKQILGSAANKAVESGKSLSAPPLGSGLLNGFTGGEATTKILGLGSSQGNISSANTSLPSAPKNISPSITYNSNNNPLPDVNLGNQTNGSSNEILGKNLSTNSLLPSAPALGSSSSGSSSGNSYSSPSTLSSGGISYADKISAIRDRLKKSKDEYDLYANPTEEENQVQSQIDALNTQLKNLNASKEAGLVDVENQTIPMRFITGQQAAMERQAAAKAQGLAATAEPLTTKLARLQMQRQLQQKAKESQYNSTKDELDQLLEEQKVNQPQRVEVGGNLIEYDPVTKEYKTVFSAPAKENLPASVQEYEYAKKNGYQGSYTDYQNEDANRKAQVAKITAGGLNSVQQNAAFKLADDYEKASVDLGKIISNYNRIVASAKNASPAGDLSLIFAYMKILDPTSVVREGEFATAANAGSVGDKLINQYNKIINGERLTDAQRNDFVARAKGLYQSAINQQKQIDKTFSDRADKFGIPADYVIRSQNSFNDSPTNSQYSSLKEYKNSVSPEQFSKISSIIQQENLDETDALRLINKLGFNSPLSMGQNGSIAPKIAQKYPEGAKGGQCTTFLHSLVQFPPIGDGKTQKFASVDKFGITADQLRQNPQIGDVIVTGENKTYGHTAMINAILPNGFRVTESNFRGDEKVTHDRIIPFNSPQIYGAIRGPLKV